MGIYYKVQRHPEPLTISGVFICFHQQRLATAVHRRTILLLAHYTRVLLPGYSDTRELYCQMLCGCQLMTSLLNVHSRKRCVVLL